MCDKIVAVSGDRETELTTVRTTTRTVTRVETVVTIEVLDRGGNVVSTVPGGNFSHTNVHTQVHTHDKV